mmetsp:Transcript_464/g.1756  ORF Transcript_464/g.1756 Transcript_464/m.1756 type:complete len:384 (-) Transcript_464:1207-2358(-)
MRPCLGRCCLPLPLPPLPPTPLSVVLLAALAADIVCGGGPKPLAASAGALLCGRSLLRESLTLPRMSTSSTCTFISCPTLSTSPARPTPSCEISATCSNPCRLDGKSSRIAPYSSRRSTRARSTLPTGTSPEMASPTRARARAMLFASGAKMDTLARSPSSLCSTVSLEPLRDSMSRMPTPCSPTSFPTRSAMRSIVSTRGALSPTLSRGAEIVASIASRILCRASSAGCSADSSTPTGTPLGLMSSCTAVMPERVPQILKSMSPSPSSSPWISVSRAYLGVSFGLASSCSRSITSPTLMPATCSRTGTPASMRASEPPHTVAMELDPLEPSTSEETRTAKGKSRSSGATAASAFSASAPWPTSRRPTPPTLPTSLVAKGGME